MTADISPLLLLLVALFLPPVVSPDDAQAPSVLMSPKTPRSLTLMLYLLPSIYRGLWMDEWT
jgi:hypothetical protein